jgi:hypothetical protein
MSRWFRSCGLFLLLVTLMGLAPLTSSPPDPFYINTSYISVCSPASTLCNPNWRPSMDVSGKTVSSNGVTNNPAVVTCVFIHPGQSVVEAITPTRYTYTNSTKVDDFDVDNGQMYVANGPLTGTTTGSAPGISTPLEPLGDALITSGKCGRSILMAAGIAGTSVLNDWAQGTQATRPVAIMARLKQRGIVCGSTNVICVVIIGIGETDSFNSMSTANFLTGLTTLINIFNANGFVGYFLVNQETCCLAGTGPYAPVVTAESATTPTGIINTSASNPICKGGNVDALKGTNCNGSNACTQDGTHPTLDGIKAMATDATNGYTTALHNCAPSVF